MLGGPWLLKYFKRIAGLQELIGWRWLAVQMALKVG
jgi:hypothetical protein